MEVVNINQFKKLPRNQEFYAECLVPTPLNKMAGLKESIGILLN